MQHYHFKSFFAEISHSEALLLLLSNRFSAKIHLIYIVTLQIEISTFTNKNREKLANKTIFFLNLQTKNHARTNTYFGRPRRNVAHT